jgi:hypothetical protein
MSRFTVIRAVIWTASRLMPVGALVAGDASLASDAPVSYPPVAINAWAGVGVFYAHWSDPFGAGSTGSVHARLGGNAGFRFSRQLSLLAVVDFQAFVPDESDKPTLLLLAPGLRWQPESPFQFTFAAGYIHGSWVGPPSNGIGLRAIAFWPVLGGFGPYSQISFNALVERGRGTQLLDLTLGISYSF